MSGPRRTQADFDAKMAGICRACGAKEFSEAHGVAQERPSIDVLTFAEFAQVNRERCEAADGFGHPLSGWSVSDWFLAAMGEFGEAANKAKKLNRVRDGIPGNSETPDELRAGLADEIADTVIYLDLLAQSEGFDLGTIVSSKFNRTSEKIGSPARLAGGSVASPEPRP
jgi:NTP pyrophosphatase (non-canonical NTP hydrolase)